MSLRSEAGQLSELEQMKGGGHTCSDRIARVGVRGMGLSRRDALMGEKGVTSQGVRESHKVAEFVNDQHPRLVEKLHRCVP